MTAFTAFTLAHTTMSLLPVGFGVAAFATHGAILPKTRVGRLYLGSMFLGSLSSFGFIAKLGFTPGQVLTLFTLFLLAIGTFTLRGEWRNAGYKQTIAYTTSFLMLMVFLTTETLKRFPSGQPFASGPNDPSLIPVRLTLLSIYTVGLTYQMLKIRSQHRLAIVHA